MRVLVLGAYGLIGGEIVRALTADGCEVVGLVRSKAKAARLLPGLPCVQADIAMLRNPSDWCEIISGFDAVINASGALQNGLRDKVANVQDKAVRALISACDQERVGFFIQISASGAEKLASTEFMRSKSRADDALRASGLQYVIFKPGLVISHTAYGGTALVRALAGFPIIQPLVMPDVRLQTVAGVEVGHAVAEAVAGRVPIRREYDLVGTKAYELAEIVLQFRRWLGFEPARLNAIFPRSIGYLMAKAGDAAGWLGWRPPLRTTALRVLADDVLGDPGPWTAVMGRPPKSLEETLAETPSTLQERIFARVQILTPLILIILSAFFIASGVIGLVRSDAAAAALSGALDGNFSRVVVFAASLLDIGLGAAILVRAWARAAAVAMAVLSLTYLVFGTLISPSLWVDPLGPFMKILPVVGLALAAALLLEER